MHFCSAPDQGATSMGISGTASSFRHLLLVFSYPYSVYVSGFTANCSLLLKWLEHSLFVNDAFVKPAHLQ